MIRFLLRWLLRILYGFRAYNESVLKAPGPVLLLPNHVSWFDWLLVGVCLDDDWRFATSSTSAETSWIHKRIMVNRRTFPVDMTSPYAVKHMAEFLQGGGRLVLFPEGRISSTGSLMKLFDGTGFLLAKTRAKVITAYIRGGLRLPYSRNPDRKQPFPRVSVHFGQLLTPPPFEHVSVTEDRARLTDWLRNQMVQQQFDSEMEFGLKTVPAALVAAARVEPGRVILQDFTLQKVTYRRMLVGAELLAKQWRQLCHPEAERIGVLLPNANAMPIVTLSLWAAEKVPAILNYSVGPASLLACARLAGLKQVISSESFVARAKLDLAPLQAAGIEVLFLEHIRPRIPRGQRLASYLKQMLHPGLAVGRAQATDPAVILFTSGSEGEPKGVELTHRNLLANVRQMLAVIDVNEKDRFFNALPLFHSFGLTVGLLLPLVRGIFTFLYLSPLHYRVVPSACYNFNCTVFFGTNTFLSGYARKAHPYDFRTVRYVFAGAERLQESTVTLWMRKFGVRLLEGYGATECSPCLAANLPMHPRRDSVGRFLPGIEHRLEPVEGISGEDRQAGRLWVRGPNIMHRYLNPEPDARFQAAGGWYDTGDIVRVDPNGYVYVLGRMKRFAKISGEMVSLTAVEEILASAFPQFGMRFAVAVIAVQDASKGERLVAVTNEPKLTLEQVREAVRAHGLSNLAIPRELRTLHDLPRLGTGKVDYRRLQPPV